MGSNYAPTIHVQKEALSKGLQQVLWLYGDEHYLTEVGTMNIFLFFVNEDGGMNRKKRGKLISIGIATMNEILCLIQNFRTGIANAATERTHIARHH